MSELPRPKVWRHPRILTERGFDTLWALDLTLAELRVLLDEHAEVIEEEVTGGGSLRELVLSLHWTRSLHMVVVVDDAHQEERLITVYEPSPDRWSDDFKVRR